MKYGSVSWSVSGIVNKVRSESLPYFSLYLFSDLLQNYTSHKMSLLLLQ